MQEFPETLYELYFPEIDLGADTPDLAGFSCAYLSVFDHWLNEKEAEACPAMNFLAATTSGNAEEYLDGERKFVDLYRALSNGGVLCKTSQKIKKYDLCNGELEAVFIGSLREIKFMDVFFLGFGTRVIGGYDRTDLVIAKGKNELSEVVHQASICGIHALPV